MPKSKRGGQALFQISAWQDQRDRGPPTGDEEAAYCEVELPLVVGRGGKGGDTVSSPLDSQAMAVDTDVTDTERTAAAPWHAAPARGGGWISKRRRAADGDDERERESTAAAEGAEEGGGFLSWQQEGIQPAASEGHRSPSPQPGERQHRPQLEVLQGIAYLALLPSGNITGERSRLLGGSLRSAHAGVKWLHCERRAALSPP